MTYGFKDGILLKDGKPVKGDDGNDINLQEALNSVAQGAKAAAKKEADKKLQDEIDELNNKLTGSLSADEAKALREKISTLESAQSEEAKARAREKTEAEQKIEAARQEERGIAAKNLERARNAELEAAVMRHAASFRDPGDALRFLREQLEWEEEVDATGEKTGREIARFNIQVPHPSDKEKLVPKKGTAEEAIQRLINERPYLVKGNPRGGVGAPGGTPNLPGTNGHTIDPKTASAEQLIAAGMDQEANG